MEQYHTDVWVLMSAARATILTGIEFADGHDKEPWSHDGRDGG